MNDTHPASDQPAGARIWQRLKKHWDWAQWLFLGTVLLIVGSLIGWKLYSEHRAIDANERERLTTLATVIDQNLGRQLLATKLALESIRGDLPFLKVQADSKGLINRRLKAMSDAMPGVRTMIILDAEGAAIASNREELIGRNFRERAYFRVPKEGQDPFMLYISPPFKTVLGVFVVSLTKVVLNDKGEFGGVVTATLDPEYFTTLLDSVRYRTDVRASLAHADGKRFLVVPAQPGAEGTELLQPGTFFTRYRDSGQMAMVLTGIDGAAGEERIAALRTLQHPAVLMDKPLVLDLSRELPSIHAQWRHDAVAQATEFGLFALTTILGLLLYQKRMRAYYSLVASQRAERRQAEDQLRLSASVFTHANEGIMITAADATIIDVNDAFCRLAGYRRDEVLGRNPRLLSSGRHNKEFYAALWHDLVENGSWTGEIWNRRKDGELYVELKTISAVFDGEGNIKQYVALSSDITERKLLEAQAHQLAFYDPLTKLPNRRLLDDRLKQTLAACKRSACYGALMFLDLDNFKPLNDTHGHVVGDLLLMQAADRLSRCVRETDTVARFGGDEFVVVLNGLNSDKTESTSQARMVAENIRTALSEPYRLALHREGQADSTVEHGCSASIGVVLFVNHESSPGDILKQADAAMYQAKQSGRNSIRFAADSGNFAASLAVGNGYLKG